MYFCLLRYTFMVFVEFQGMQTDNLSNVMYVLFSLNIQFWIKEIKKLVLVKMGVISSIEN